MLIARVTKWFNRQLTKSKMVVAPVVEKKIRLRRLEALSKELYNLSPKCYCTIDGYRLMSNMELYLVDDGDKDGDFVRLCVGDNVFFETKRGLSNLSGKCRADKSDKELTKATRLLARQYGVMVGVYYHLQAVKDLGNDTVTLDHLIKVLLGVNVFTHNGIKILSKSPFTKVEYVKTDSKYVMDEPIALAQLNITSSCGHVYPIVLDDNSTMEVAGKKIDLEHIYLQLP